MTRDEFAASVLNAVRQYIDNTDIVDDNPQLRINPVSLDVILINGRDMFSEIADSDEAVENAAAAERPWDEDTSDYQVRQNPDFYAVKSLIKQGTDGLPVPDQAAIDAIAVVYFG